MPTKAETLYRSRIRPVLGRFKRAVIRRMPSAARPAGAAPVAVADGAWPASIDPVHHQPPLPLPVGLTRESVLESLASISIEDSPRGELEGYARQDCDRFVRTVDLVPEEPGKVLEIGAGPYFTTTLLRRFRPGIELTLTNYFGGETGSGSQLVDIDGFDGRPEHYEMAYANVNIEENRLPFDDGTFDVILYCEVLEHMTNDPWQTLVELKRVLRPLGLLVLTTPNAARLENIARLVAGENVYDVYSGYGPYGRHNREYIQPELVRLLERCGFAVETIYTADVHHNRAPEFCDLRRLAELIPGRSTMLGQYFFTASRNVAAAAELRPDWLYRSYPAELLGSDGP